MRGRACGETHALLAELLRHEHASLALAQRCSGVPAPAPLFTALLNYRHSQACAAARSARRRTRAWEGIEVLRGEERTNYPLTLSVDDLGEGFALTAQVAAAVDAERVCGYMQHGAGGAGGGAGDESRRRRCAAIEVLPAEERRRVLRRGTRRGGVSAASSACTSCSRSRWRGRRTRWRWCSGTRR